MNLALENHYINEMATGKLDSNKRRVYSKPKEEFAKEIMANALTAVTPLNWAVQPISDLCSGYSTARLTLYQTNTPSRGR